MKIEKLVLEGHGVRLEPLVQSHLAGIARAIEDGALWQIPVTFVPHPSDLPAFLSDAESAFQAGRELAFATVDKQTDTVVGSTRFRCAEVAHKRVEIGFTFFARSFQRTHVNSACKLLMLGHAFEVWQMNRVELLTDVLNEKSRNAIARLGAQQEGIIRSHMVMRDGRVRDSVLFSIIQSEWPKVKGELESKLAVARP